MAEIDSAPRLNTVSRDKKSASVRHLMSRQILTRFDPDEKSAVLRQKNRLVCGSLYEACSCRLELGHAVFCTLFLTKMLPLNAPFFY